MPKSKVKSTPRPRSSLIQTHAGRKGGPHPSRAEKRERKYPKRVRQEQE